MLTERNPLPHQRYHPNRWNVFSPLNCSEWDWGISTFAQKRLTYPHSYLGGEHGFSNERSAISGTDRKSLISAGFLWWFFTNAIEFAIVLTRRRTPPQILYVMRSNLLLSKGWCPHHITDNCCGHTSASLDRWKAQVFQRRCQDSVITHYCPDIVSLFERADAPLWLMPEQNIKCHRLILTVNGKDFSGWGKAAGISANTANNHVLSVRLKEFKKSVRREGVPDCHGSAFTVSIGDSGQ